MSDDLESADESGIDVWRDLEWVYRNLGDKSPPNPPTSAALAMHAAASKDPADFVQRFIKQQNEREARKLVSDSDLAEDRKATLRQIEKLRRAVAPDVDGLIREAFEMFPDQCALTLNAIGWDKRGEDPAIREAREALHQHEEAERLRDAELSKREQELLRREHEDAQLRLNLQTEREQFDRERAAFDAVVQAERAAQEKIERAEQKRQEAERKFQERRAYNRQKWEDKQRRIEQLRQDERPPEEPAAEHGSPEADQHAGVL